MSKWDEVFHAITTDMKVWVVICFLWYFFVVLMILIELGLLIGGGSVVAYTLYGGLPQDLPRQVMTSIPKAIIYSLSVFRLWLLLPLILLVILSQVAYFRGMKHSLFTSLSLAIALASFEMIIYFISTSEPGIQQGLFYGTRKADLLGYFLPICLSNIILVFILRSNQFLKVATSLKKSKA